MKLTPETGAAHLLIKLAEIRNTLTALEVLSGEPERNEVARVVTENGLGAYVGGRHVAIHCNRNGKIVGERLAIITGNGPDWN